MYEYIFIRPAMDEFCCLLSIFIGIAGVKVKYSSHKFGEIIFNHFYLVSSKFIWLPA